MALHINGAFLEYFHLTSSGLGGIRSSPEEATVLSRPTLRVLKLDDIIHVAKMIPT